MSVWKRRQKHLWFQILHLYWLFSSYIMTVKGLKQAEMQQITVYIYIYMLCSVSWVRKFCTLLTPSCCTYSSFLRLSSVLVMIFVKSEDRWLNSERSKSIKFNTKLILSTHTAPLPAHTLTHTVTFSPTPPTPHHNYTHLDWQPFFGFSECGRCCQPMLLIWSQTL